VLLNHLNKFNAADMLPFQKENGSAGIFLIPFTVFSSCKWKFVVCPSVKEETHGSSPFEKRIKWIKRI
jgi:hypothetical protein